MYTVEQLGFYGDTYITHHATQESAFQGMEAMKREEIEGNNQYTITAHYGNVWHVVHRETTPPKIAELKEGEQCPVCANRSDTDGFDPCMPDGRRVEPTADGPWKGHYICNNCGQIVTVAA